VQNSNQTWYLLMEKTTAPIKTNEEGIYIYIYIYILASTTYIFYPWSFARKRARVINASQESQ